MSLQGVDSSGRGGRPRLPDDAARLPSTLSIMRRQPPFEGYLERNEAALLRAAPISIVTSVWAGREIFG